MKRILPIAEFGGGRDSNMRRGDGGAERLDEGLHARIRSVGIAPLLTTGCGIALCLYTLLNPARAAPPNRDEARAKVLAEVPIDRAGAPVVVEALIFERSYRLLVATGSSHSLLDVRHRAALGKPNGKAVIDTEHGTRDIEMFHVPEIRIGGLPFLLFSDVACGRFECIDAHGIRIDGVLGMDALERSVLRIDFDGGTLQFLDIAEPRLGRPVPMFRMAGDDWKRPFVRAVVGDRAENFLIDTGDTAFFSGTRDKRRILSSQPNVLRAALAPTRMSGESVDAALAAGMRMSFGGFRHSDLVFRVGSGASTLGIGYLSRYCVVFDFLNDVVYLRPGMNFSRRDRYDLSGMDIRQDHEGVFATNVRRESAAEHAGIAGGDPILTVDGIRADMLGRSAILRSLCEPELHLLEIDRGGSSLRIKLDLRYSANVDTDTGAEAHRP